MDLREYSPLPRHRAELAEEIGRTADFGKLRTLQKILGDKNLMCRAHAAQALSKVPAPSSIPLLIRALSDPGAVLRNVAVTSLGNIGEALNDRQMLEPLIRSLKDDDSGVRSSASRALARLGEESSVSAIANAIECENTWVIWQMIQSANEMGWQPTSKIAQTILACIRGGADDVLRQNPREAAWIFELIAFERDMPADSRNGAIYWLGELDYMVAHDALVGDRFGLHGRHLAGDDIEDAIRLARSKWYPRWIAMLGPSPSGKPHRRSHEWNIMMTVDVAGQSLFGHGSRPAKTSYSEFRRSYQDVPAGAVCVLYNLGLELDDTGGQFVFDSIDVTDVVGRPATPNALQAQKIWREIKSSWSGHWAYSSLAVKNNFLRVVPN